MQIQASIMHFASSLLMQADVPSKVYTGQKARSPVKGARLWVDELNDLFQKEQWFS